HSTEADDTDFEIVLFHAKIPFKFILKSYYTTLCGKKQEKMQIYCVCDLKFCHFSVIMEKVKGGDVYAAI
ncbi:MAG: hypothetical protein IJF31_00055, partial [Clostridia bacterium]|nr:hypothetical protein [Clostridia bacterium]